MRKMNASQEIMSLKRINCILQEQLNGLEKDVRALGDLKEHVTAIETFLRVRFPEFPVADRSCNSFSQSVHSSSEHQNDPLSISGVVLPTLSPTDSTLPTKSLDVGSVNPHHVLENDEDEGENIFQNCRRSKNEEVEKEIIGMAHTTTTPGNFIVVEWLNTHNLEANTDRKKASSPKATRKRPKVYKSQDKLSAKKSKPAVTSNKRSSSGKGAMGNCVGNVNGKICKKLTRLGCDICGKFLCPEHRYSSITCENYVESIKDCFRDFEKNLDSPDSVHLYNHVDSKKGTGRCACCEPGRGRRPSRTRCQVCRRCVCKEHQVKKIRCGAHRFHSLARAVDVDSDCDNSSVNYSPRPDIIDHIDVI